MRRAFIALGFPATIGAIVFVSAGRMDLPLVWGLLGLLTLFVLTAGFVLDPRLLQERVRPGPGAIRDYHRALCAPLVLAHWILTGLDLGRFHWSDTFPREVQLAGLVGYGIGLAITLWAMTTNTFYSSVIRIQRDRGQQPVTVGPYRYVRHPGYLATIVCCLSGGLALGSWVGAAPLVVVALLFLRRTVTEDRILREQLEGYASYAERVRFRLIPGVW